MATKKFYAVKKGLITGIFETWEECKGAVDGFSGAEYKSFKTKEEACAYLGVECSGSKEKLQDEFPKEPELLVAYVDGSYEHSLLKYAFGCVFLLPDRRIFIEKGSGNNPESAKLRNVTGEMLGAMFAVKWAMKNGFSRIEIRYDYEGVEKWVTGAWKSKTELTQKYAEAMRSWSSKIGISFTKVAAHTNVYYNEMADQLAKEALLQPEGIPVTRLADEMEAI
ncbi:MAG: ribonuclease H family protein [Lachnospiraceae bacterium]|nr:ribonuclease H family protein [Lachnospiraceae bacterium]MBR4082857.1 ribonuclease H family protein [Lachnospiraceae bacterium]